VKLFCTFSQEELLEDNLDIIKNRYNILNNKIFVLKADNGEYICTYNIDQYNTTGNLIEGTILAHRKKEFNCIYSLNSLNILIKSLNNGILDKNYPINWNEYKDSFLLTQNGEFKRLNTKLYKIISL
jgi:hypothetical protein